MSKIPYAEFVQTLRILHQEKLDAYKQELKNLAFLGFQQYRMQPGAKSMTYGEYLTNVGLGEPVDTKREKAKAANLLERAKKAFKKGANRQ